jgi:hypothetical protein
MLRHDFIEGGMEEDESRTVCGWLEEAGFSCIFRVLRRPPIAT